MKAPKGTNQKSRIQHAFPPGKRGTPDALECDEALESRYFQYDRCSPKPQNIVEIYGSRAAVSCYANRAPMALSAWAQGETDVEIQWRYGAL